MATTPTEQLETTETAAAHHIKFAKVSAEYRKAHKNYVLVAAVLASWELIGINLNTKEKWGIEFVSPKAVPLILFTLLVYCAYKTVIEWNLEDDPKPKSRRARIDYWVAHAIAASAVLIGVVQAMLKVRVADVVTGYMAMLYFMAFIIGFGVQFVRSYDMVLVRVILGIMSFMAAALYAMAFRVGNRKGLFGTVLFTIAGGLISFLLFRFLEYRNKKTYGRSATDLKTSA